MKKFNHKIKRAAAMFLTFAMVVGRIPYVPTRAHEVQAATTSSIGGTPSVSAYATKEQMMDGTFAMNADGIADNYGKILFGKAESFNGNTDTHPIEWLILGKDEGVAGDNTIILATRGIVYGEYNIMPNNGEYINIAKDITENDDRYPLKNTYVYPGGTLPTEIDYSHYGLSLLRARAISAAKDSGQFSSAQQELMNATTVTTTDTRNMDSAGKNLTYTTTDKLYAPATDKDGCTYIKVGSNNQVVIDIESCTKYYGSWFQYWTRTARAKKSVYIFPYLSPAKTSFSFSNEPLYFLPVSNLNLSNVLFASSAKAATSNTESGAVSGTIADDTAMSLRLDGTGKNIGVATYNAETGTIEVTKGITSQTVSLVVQGKGMVGEAFW